KRVITPFAFSGGGLAILIPKTFRDALHLDSNNLLVASLDLEKRVITLTPLTVRETRPGQLEVTED
ncbi:MAG: hypothetical protein QXZ06_08430, partial [Candidatus Jordarchaeales archaeon]